MSSAEDRDREDQYDDDREDRRKRLPAFEIDTRLEVKISLDMAVRIAKELRNSETPDKQLQAFFGQVLGADNYLRRRYTEFEKAA